MTEESGPRRKEGTGAGGSQLPSTSNNYPHQSLRRQVILPNQTLLELHLMVQKCPNFQEQNFGRGRYLCSIMVWVG